MKTLNKLITKIFFRWKKWVYSSFSTNNNFVGKYIAQQPVVIRGKGKIEFGNNVKFGVINSPMFYDSYAYIEARAETALIEFGNNISINNNFKITAEKSIKIGDNTLIGFNCLIMDSNFHDLDPINRKNTDRNPKSVSIGKNVFIGHNVTILKGVKLGDNCVVGANTLVTKSFPENVVITGNPGKVIRELN